MRAARGLYEKRDICADTPFLSYNTHEGSFDGELSHRRWNVDENS
jgi:hypothetical protein